MLSKKFKDIKKRNVFFKLEYYKKIYKIAAIALLNNIRFKKNKKYFYSKLLKIQEHTKYFSKVQIKNRCVLSNRNKAVARPFFLSRIKMREFIHSGLLPGYKKAVW